MNLNNIPEELRARDQWVIYRSDKHPRNVVTGQHASLCNARSRNRYDTPRISETFGEIFGLF